MKNFFPSILFCAIILISCKKEGGNSASAKKNTATQTTVLNPADNYKYSLAQWSLNKPFKDGSMDPMDFAKIAKELGFTGLEYVSQLYPEVEEAVGKPNYREAVMNLSSKLLEQSKVHGMENVLIMIDHAGELADPDDQKRKEAIENHKIWMDAAAMLGAHSIRANLFGVKDPQKWHEVSVASLKELGDYGKNVGVNIIIENHGGLSSHGKKLAAVMTAVEMDNCGTLPDFGNFCVARRDGDRWGSPCIDEYDIYHGVAELMPFAKGVSAKSYTFDEEGMDTKIDYPKMLEIVHNAGYKGYIGVEYEGDLANPIDGINLTKKLIEKSIAQLK